MQKKTLSKAKKRFFLLTIALVVVVSLSIIQIFQDWISIVSNKTEIQNLNNYYDELLAEEESLNSEVTKLHDSEYVARYAREKYMYSLPGEFIIKMPTKDE
ncbi:septum formation initiator family protein [bacterium]|uniref:FtsB family cell division protein n=1 Tax=Candidatus Ventrenecus sp. TaxID=3085654 RepID=UPI001D2C0F24|nr:septum formation initiator family protein [bacterium]